MKPFPVITCDVCGTPTPALFGGRRAVSPAEREQQLCGEGWQLGPEGDFCPAHA